MSQSQKRSLDNSPQKQLLGDIGLALQLKDHPGWGVVMRDAQANFDALSSSCTLSPNAIEYICQALQDGKTLLAAPEPVIDTSQSSWWVKQYYRAWLSLPYIQEGVVATCSYILSDAGRQRFNHFS